MANIKNTDPNPNQTRHGVLNDLEDEKDWRHSHPPGEGKKEWIIYTLEILGGVQKVEPRLRKQEEQSRKNYDTTSRNFPVPTAE